MRRTVAERTAERLFNVEKLGFSAAALAATPFFLVYRGAPTLAETAIFALALLQMGAAMIVARQGRLVIGQMVAAGSFAGIAVAFAIGVPGGLVACFAWLVVAAMEAISSFDVRTSRIAGASIVAALALTLIVTIPAAPATGTIVMAGVAVIAALVISQRIVLVRAVERGSVIDERARGEAVAKALGKIVIGFDRDGLVEHASSDCEDVLGLRCDDLAGRGMFEHVHVADRPAFLKLVADAAHDGGTHVAELRLRQGAHRTEGSGPHDPRHVWVEMRAHRIESVEAAPNGASTGLPADSAVSDGVVAILTDITDSRQHSAEIDDANRSVEEATRSRDEFLANMSHELRTPLNAIIGFSEMLASQTIRPVEDSKQREYARIIHQSGQHLLSVVNSILDMSKIQSGTFTLIPEPFEVAPLVEQCCDMMRLKAEAGKVELVRDIPPRIAEALGDRRACKQILINLLSNAVKFTPEHGRVTVRLRPDGASMRITVVDTGIGINKADLSRLGDPFFQARSSISRPYEGTGLGLSVVRGLIDLHGGSLDIDSEPGKGTTVTVRLPFDRRATVPDKTASDREVGMTYSIAERRRASDVTLCLDANDTTEQRIKQIA